LLVKDFQTFGRSRLWQTGARLRAGDQGGPEGHDQAAQPWIAATTISFQ
jgi:hypothetical protein